MDCSDGCDSCAFFTGINPLTIMGNKFTDLIWHGQNLLKFLWANSVTFLQSSTFARTNDKAVQRFPFPKQQYLK